MKKIKKFISTTLIGGFVVLLPLAILFLLIKFLIGIIYKILNPLSMLLHKAIGVELSTMPYDAIAFGIVISIFFFLGLVVRTRIGQNLFERFENRSLAKLPMYSAIKKTVQQFSGVQKMPFSEVVLVDAYGSGLLMTGFVTDKHPNGRYTVFVPTAPNPTNGFVFDATEDQIIRTPEVSTEDAMRTIIGMGVGTEGVFEFSKRDYKLNVRGQIERPQQDNP